MTTDDNQLDSNNRLPLSTILTAGKHYTGALFWTPPNKQVDPEVIFAELRAIDIRIFSHELTENGFWFVFEPQQKVVVGGLALVGYAHSGVLGVWDYRPLPEESLDFKEWFEDLQSSAKSTVSFVVNHWLAILIVLLGILALVVWLILRK